MTTTRMRYADPTRCPDCRYVLPAEPFACPECRLPLRSALASELLTTLTTADDLLARLRASAVVLPMPMPVPSPMPTPTPVPAQPAAVAAAPALPARGLRTASVPKVLLGLGAMCLLVAAVIFLAVAWSWLGIGGRTAVLVGLTAASGGAGIWLARRGLRVAAEALTTVALGLLVLDVVGADDAGWLGDLSFSGVLTTVGAALVVASLGLLIPREQLVPQLTAPQVIAPLGPLLVWGGLGAETTHHQILATVAVLAFATMAAFGHALRAAPLQWTAGLGATLPWSGLGMLALADALEHPTARELWLEGHGWGLVAGALLALLPWVLNRSVDFLRVSGTAFAASTITFAIALPGLDDGATRATLVAATATVLWALVAAVAPQRWYVAARVPLAGSAVLPAVVAAGLTAQAAWSLLVVGQPFTVSAAVRLDPGELVLPPAMLLVTVTALVVAAALALPRARWFWWVVLAVFGVAGTATLVLLSAPLWSILLVVTATAAGLLAHALRRVDERGTTEALGAVALLGAAALVAVPSAVLLTAVLTVLVVGAITVWARGRFPYAAALAGCVLPAALAAMVWSAGEVLDVDAAVRAAPILVVLGALAIARPRAEVEVSAALAALLATAVAVPLASDVSVSLAVHLTLAGALVTASALLNPTRRWLGWLGGLLLAGATWVRLADIGVEAPEPYTLPSALALVLVGLHRLRTSPETSTMSALGPGLALATVPSLLWVLNDPISTRAGLLGIACLCLVLSGTWSRWNAPVLVGSVVGCLVVVRELAPYAAQTPQWVLIGGAGALLVATGVTWEARLRDMQHAAAYLGRLR